MADESSPKTPRQHFFSSFTEGVQSTVSAWGNAFRPSNYGHASRQTGQLWGAVTHPGRTADTLHHTADALHENVDVPSTFGRTAGDIAGGALTLAVGTFAVAAAVRNPYLRTRLANQLSQRYSSSPVLQNPVLQHPKVRDFFVTRPLSFAVVAGLGTAAFIGGAKDRADTAKENAQQHPEVNRRLQAGQLHEVLATPVSRIVKPPTTKL